MNTSPTLAAEKRVLRERVLVLRDLQPPAEVVLLSEQVAMRLLALPELARAKSIFCYVSGGGEVATHDLLRGWLDQGRRVFVPAFDKTHRRYQPAVLRDFDNDLVSGHFGLLEPKELTLPDVPMEVAIVPGVAFDERGHRLGFGKGYYDRMLRDFEGVKIGLAFDWQTQWPVPAGEHDVRMDFVVTETLVLGNQA